MAEKFVSVTVSPDAFLQQTRQSVTVVVDKKEEKDAKPIKYQSYCLPRQIITSNSDIYLIEYLRQFGLSDMLPIAVFGANTTDNHLNVDFTRIDATPVGYSGPGAWVFHINGIKCHILFYRHSIYIHIYSGDVNLGKLIIGGIYDHIHKAYLAELAKVPKLKNSLKVYRTYDRQGCQWANCGDFAGKDLDHVYIDEDIKDRLSTQLAKFYSSQSVYDKYCVRWKRVHLFEGPPGTGKTSLAMALAVKFGKNIAKLTITQRMTAIDVETLFANVPTGSCLLLEDIDSLFVGRNNAENNTTVDFSTLLNLLDGITTQPGLVVFMTTNHAEKLDKALVRPGRVDSRTFFDLPEKQHIRAALKNLGDLWPAQHEEFIEKCPKTTIAGLQKYLFDCMQLERKSILENIDDLTV